MNKVGGIHGLRHAYATHQLEHGLPVHELQRLKDYRDGNRPETLTLDGETFVRRFLLHVLPKGLMRIRHYGFLANRCRRDKLARIRQALAAPPSATPQDSTDTVTPGYPCPKCRQGRLLVIGMLLPRTPVSMSPG